MDKIGNMKALEIIEEAVYEFMYKHKDQEVVRPINAGDDGLIRMSIDLFKRFNQEIFLGKELPAEKIHNSHGVFRIEKIYNQCDDDYCEVIYAPRVKGESFADIMRRYKETGMMPTTHEPKLPVMETYVSCKVVRAIPMTKHSYEVEKGGFENPPFPRNCTLGYKVVYDDGQTSWWPKDMFEGVHRKITEAEKKMFNQ